MNQPLLSKLCFAWAVACTVALPCFDRALTQALLGVVGTAALSASVLLALIPKVGSRQNVDSSEADLKELQATAQKALQSASQVQNQFNDFVTRTGLDAINKF